MLEHFKGKIELAKILPSIWSNFHICLTLNICFLRCALLDVGIYKRSARVHERIVRVLCRLIHPPKRSELVMSSHSPLYLDSPGISVLGNLFTGFRSYVASI